MKSLSLFLGMLMFLQSQAQVPGGIETVKSISNYKALPNGKCILSKSISYNPKARFLLNGKEAVTNIPKADKPVNPEGPTLLTHHIIFHFDMTTDVVWLNGSDTVFMDMWNMTWTSNNTLEGDLVDGYYELLVLMSMKLTYKTDFRCITKKDFHVYRDMDTTILSTSAHDTVNLILNDENGIPINYFPTMTHDGDGFGFALEFPGNYKAPDLSVCYSNFVPQICYFTDVDDEFKIALGRRDATKTEPYKYYVVSYPVLPGIHGDTTMQDEPADLKHFPLYFHGSPGGTDYFLAWGYGTVDNDSLLGGYADPFVGTWETDDYPGIKNDTVHLYTTNVGIDTNNMFFGACVDHMERSTSSLMLADLMTPIVFLNTQDDLILSTEGNFPTVPTDYKIANGSRLDLGITAPFSVTWGFNSAANYQIWLRSHFRGQTSERRYIDSGIGTYDLWDGNVHLIHDSLRVFDVIFNNVALDHYSLILNDSNYTLLGKSGYSQTNLSFDLSKPDANAPTLLAFKILMCDSIRNELIHSYDASVKFTAADYTYPANGIRLYHTIDQVHLYYKEYSGSTWDEIPVNPQPGLLDSISGMPYYADLGQMMNQYPDSAWINLKLVLTDSTGNSNTQIMHPACLIRDPMVGVGTVSPDISFKIYPNPAAEKLNISTNATHYTISIYSVTGQLMMQGSDLKSMNVSGLGNGVYMVRLTTTKDGQYLTVKFVK